MKLRGCRCYTIRLATLYVIVQLALFFVLPPANSAASTSLNNSTPKGQPLPVILVHGVGGDPESTWGISKEGRIIKGSIYNVLLNYGYVPGLNLFVLDYSNESNEDYVLLSKQRLAPIIEEAKRRSAQPMVDIITYDMGALIARYYIASTNYRGDVRTLVMIAPPNKGSLLATIIKESTQIDKEAVSGYRGGNDVSTTPVTDKTFPHFHTSSQYIHDRSRFYEELYFEYLLDTKISPIKSQGLTQANLQVSFEEWLAQARPEIFQASFLDAQYPPVKPEYELQVTARPPADGEALTRAYFEKIALNVAKRRVAIQSIEQKDLFTVLMENPYVGSDWKTTLIHYITKVAAHYFQVALQYFGIRSDGITASAAARLLNLDADGIALERLIKVESQIPTGRDHSGKVRYVPIKSNYFLDTWNKLDSSLRTSKTASLDPRFSKSSSYPEILSCPPWPTKQATISAKMLLNPWRISHGNVGVNDLTLELESTLLPLIENDVFRVISGLLGPNHVSILRNKQLQTELVRLLSQYYPVARELNLSVAEQGTAPSTLRGSISASYWQPTYLKISTNHVENRCIHVVLEGPSSPSWEAWAYTFDDLGNFIGRSRFSPPSTTSTNARELTIPNVGNKAKTVLIGARLLLDSTNSVENTLAEKPRKLYYRVALTAQQDAFKDPPSTTNNDSDNPTQAATVHQPTSSTSTSTDPSFQSPNFSSSNQAISSQTSSRSTPNQATLSQAPNPSSSQSTESAISTAAASDSSTESIQVSENQIQLPEDSTDDLGSFEQTFKPKDPVVITVKRSTKQTTTKDESRTYHSMWQFDFGDGQTLTDPDPNRINQEVVHTFTQTGTYQVTAKSIANTGRTLVSKVWNVEIAEPNTTLKFEATTISEPDVNINIIGPKSWITGRPAKFKVEVTASKPPNSYDQLITIYPSNEFSVIWEKPGTYSVKAAATIRTSYRIDGKAIIIWNTYVKEIQVKVLTTSFGN